MNIVNHLTVSPSGGWHNTQFSSDEFVSLSHACGQGQEFIGGDNSGSAHTAILADCAHGESGQTNHPSLALSVEGDGTGRIFCVWNQRIQVEFLGVEVFDAVGHGGLDFAGQSI